ncbi:MAG: hypothetical protein AseanaTS_21300 [Candidatus Pelagadaptatus aseana]
MVEGNKMSVKRFVAADMRRALELVRQEMGPDAVILSSRRIKQGVEILTSFEPPADDPKQPLPVDTPVDGVDVPMNSDGSWRDQVIAEKAMADNADRIIGTGHSGMEAFPETIPPRPAFSPEIDQSRGLASGKTPEQLAQEIENARNRMLASKKANAAMEQPIAQMREPMAQISQEAFASAAPAAPADQSAFHSENTRAMAVKQPTRPNNYEEDARRERDLAMRERDAERQQQKLDSLQSELADMRLLLEQQLNRIARAPKFDSPAQSAVLRRLQQMGVAEELAQELASQLRSCNNVQDAWTEALTMLSRELPANSSDRVMNGGVFALVGPTGVGKTTTLAKLAARYVLEHGAQNVTLVTTDTYRLAAQEQLRSLGRILGVQVKVVDDNSDLPAVLRSLKHCPLVLIDTAGFRSGESMLKQQLQVIKDIPEVQTLLVMASNSQYQTLKAAVHSHNPEKLAGCIVTKLDDTASLGDALSVIMEHQLPVFYTTDGQEIPQDLHVAKGHQLVARAVSLLKDGQVYAQGAI